MTMRETITEAVHAAIAGALPSALVERNADAPVSIPAGGHVIVRDAAPEEEDRTLGVRSYTFRLPVAVELYATGAGRTGALDTLCAAVSTAVTADATLSMLSLTVDPRLDERQTLTDDGAGTIEAALVTVDVLYQTISPIG